VRSNRVSRAVLRPAKSTDRWYFYFNHTNFDAALRNASVANTIASRSNTLGQV
jgi:hypothetical protein